MASFSIKVVVFVLGVSLLSVRTQAATCQALDATSWCMPIIAYNATIIMQSTCQAAQENAFSVVQTIGSIIPIPQCLTAFAQYACTTIYPNCADALAFGGKVKQSICTTLLDTSVCPAPLATAINSTWNAQLAPATGVTYLSNCKTDDAVSATYRSNPVVQVPKCQTYTGTVCANFINKPIYVPYYTTQAAVETALAQAAFGMISLPTAACRDKLMQIVCNSAFPQCIFPVTGSTAPFPSFPTNGLCQDVRATCTAGGPTSASFQVWGTFGQVSATTFNFVNCSSARPLDYYCSGSTAVPNNLLPNFPTGNVTLPNGIKLNPNPTFAASAATLQTQPACEPLRSNSWCASIIAYNASVVRQGQCQADQENALSAVQTAISMVDASSSDPAACRQYTAQYSCSTLFPNCLDALQQKKVKKSICDGMTASCSAANLAQMGTIWNQQIYPSLKVMFRDNCGTDDSAVATYRSNPVVTYPKCETYTGTFCSNFISGSIYVPATQPQAATEAALVKNAFAILLVHRRFCRDKLMRLICNTAFPKCVTPLASLGLPAPFFSFPQNFLCTDARDSCSASLAGVGSATVFNNFASVLNFGNCSNTYPITYKCNASNPNVFLPSYTVANFPVTSVTLPTGLVLPANSGPTGSAITPVNSNFRCPEPTVNLPDSDTTTVGVSSSSCTPRCPSLLYTEDEYRQSDRVMAGISFTGLVLESILMFTYLAFKKTRRSYYTIYFSANLWFVSWVLFFSVTFDDSRFGRYANMNCANEYEIRKDGYCLFQTFVMVFTGLSAVAWWFLQATDLYLQIRWNARKWGPDLVFRKNITYYVWGWGWPFLAVLIVAGSQNGGGSTIGIPWCFIVDDNMSWGLFYGPVGAQSFLGATMMLLIVYSIYQSSTASGAHKRKGWWRIYIRPLIFISVFLLVWGFVFAFRFREHFKEDQYKDEAGAWIKCVLQDRPTAAALGLPAVSCDVRPNVSKALWWLIQINIAGVGIWGFFVYNTNENFVMWYHFLLCKKYNFSRTTGDSASKGNSRTSKTVPMTKSTTKRTMKGASKSTQHLVSSDDGTTQAGDDGTAAAGDDIPPSSSEANLASDAGETDPDKQPPVEPQGTLYKPQI